MVVTVECRKCGQRYFVPIESAKRAKRCRICAARIRGPRRQDSAKFARAGKLGAVLLVLTVAAFVWWHFRLPSAQHVQSRAYSQLFGLERPPWFGIHLVHSQNSPQFDNPKTIHSEFDWRGRFRWTKSRSHEALHASQMGFDGNTVWRRLGNGRSLAITHYRDCCLADEWIDLGFWAHPECPLHLTVDRELSSSDTVVLNVRHPEGPFRCQLFVNRATGLPNQVTFALAGDSVRREFHDYHQTPVGKQPKRIDHFVNEELTCVATLEQADWQHFPEDTFYRPSDQACSQFREGEPTSLKVKSGRGTALQVQPKINGQVLGWFLVDTGAYTTTIYDSPDMPVDLPLLGKHKGRAIGPEYEYRSHFANSIELGPVRLERTVVHMLRLATNHRDIAGVVGLDILGEAVMEFDSLNKRIVLHDPESFELVGGTWRDAIGDFALSASVDVAGRGEFTLCLDTGASSGVYLGEPIVASTFSDHLGRRRICTGFGGGRNTTLATEVKWVRFGGLKSEHVPISMDVEDNNLFADNPYCHGLLGTSVMHGFRVFFDLKNRRFALLEN